MRTLGNIIWFLHAGIWMTIGHILSAILCFITIIGISFGVPVVVRLGQI